MVRNIEQYPSRSGRLIREDGSVVNEAAGINDDGSRNVRIVTGSAGGDTLTTNLLSVTTPGTRVRFPDIPCREVTVIARAGNTGAVFVGDSLTSATRYGVKLQPDGSFTFSVSNANLIYIDAEQAGDGVSYVAV